MAGVDVKEIISKVGIDSVTKTREELEKAYLALQDNIAGYKTLNEVMSKSKGMGDLSKNADAASVAQEKLRQAVLRTQQMEEKLEQTRAAAAEKENARQAKKDAAEAKQIAKDNARIARIQAIEAAETARAQQANIIAQQEIANSTAITAAEANEATARGRVNVERDRAANSSQRTAIEIEQERQNNIANTRELRNNAREQNAARGSLDQRRLALTRLRGVFDGLNQAERQSPFGQRLATVIPQLNEQVLELERSTGRAQRNVGNYGSAFGRAASTAFSGLRTIANILPGVGIAGLLAFATEPIIDYISQLDIFKKKIGDTAQTIASTSSEYKKALSDVTAIKTSIEEFNNGTISKTELVNRFNESIGETIGKVTTAQQVEDFYNKRAAAYVQATYLRAQANAALELSTTKATEALQRQIDGPSIGDYFKAILVNIPKGITGASGVIGSALKFQTAGVESLNKEGKDLISLFDKLKKEADKYAKDNGFSFVTKAKGPKGIDPEIQARKNAAALIQVQIDLAKEEASIYKLQQDNLDYSLETRLESQLKYEETSAKISELEAKKSKAEKINSKEEIKAIETRSQTEINKITRDGVEERFKIIKQEYEQAEQLRLTLGQRRLTVLEKTRDEELIAINNAYLKEEINLEIFEKRKLEIAKKYNLIEIAEQLRQAEQLIAVQKLAGIDTTDAEAKLTELKLKRLSLLTDATKDANEKQILSEKEKAEAIKEVALSAYDFTRGLAASIFEGNISNLEKEKEARQSATDLQLENVQESLLSEKEKADQSAIITAQGAQAQLAIDAKIREQKRKAAIADKVFAIGQITINTAVAISKALAQTGVLGTFVIPGIIALGAIQAATVLAQPIPKFAKGGIMAKDGLAEYGHGRELRIDPDGKTSITSDKPEIGFVKKGTRFISAPETKRLMAKPDKYDIAGKSWDISPLLASNERLGKKIDKSIGKIQLNSTIVTERGFNKQSGRMNNINRYISKNFSRN